MSETFLWLGVAVVVYAALEMRVGFAAAAGDLVTAVGIALWKIADLDLHFAVGGHEEETNVACCGLYFHRLMYFGREFCMVAVDDCGRICSLRFADEGIP